MRIFSQSAKLENVRYDIRGKVSDEADKLSASGVSVLKLNTGNPAPFGFIAPDQLLQILSDGAINAQGYSQSKGLLRSREAIAQYALQKRIPDVSEEDVFIGNGVSELIIMAMQALIDEGDEILIPMPDYPLWTSSVYFSGGKPVHYICDEQSDWYPDINDIKNKITDKTRGIVIINPNNPTGAVYPKELLEEIARIAIENELVIYSDEIYDRVIFDGYEHTAMGEIVQNQALVMTFNGLSKSHRIAGYRCGWMCISGKRECATGYINGLEKLASIRLCSNVLAQALIPEALACNESAMDWVQPGGKLCEQRDFITRAINSIPGISAVKPHAGLYIFPKIDANIYDVRDDEQFVLDFLKHHHVLLTHGGAYNWNAPDHFRIVFLPSIEEMSAMIDDLSEFMSRYIR